MGKEREAEMAEWSDISGNSGWISESNGLIEEWAMRRSRDCPDS